MPLFKRVFIKQLSLPVRNLIGRLWLFDKSNYQLQHQSVSFKVV